MYKRFFAFGCSFTEYRWATWADIVAYAYKDVEYYNFGKAGGSNQIIMTRVMEADEQFKFNKDDLVIVQWTGSCRESRWRDGYWGGGGGNIYVFNNHYPKEWVENWTHPTDFLIKDLAAMKAVNALLKTTQCTYFNISMASVLVSGQSSKTVNTNKDALQTIIKGYTDTLKIVRPSYQTVIFNDKDWVEKLPRPLSSRINFQDPEQKEILKLDTHPTPTEHLQYVRTVLPELTIAPDADAIAEKETAIVMPGPNREADAPLTSLFGSRPDPKRARDSFFFYKRLKEVPPQNIAPFIH